MLEYVSIIRGQFATPVDGQTVDIGKILQISEPAKLLNAILTSANHILALDRINPDDSKDKKGKTHAKMLFASGTVCQKGYALCGALKAVEPYKQELAFMMRCVPPSSKQHCLSQSLRAKTACYS